MTDRMRATQTPAEALESARKLLAMDKKKFGTQLGQGLGQKNQEDDQKSGPRLTPQQRAANAERRKADGKRALANAAQGVGTVVRGIGRAADDLTR